MSLPLRTTHPARRPSSLRRRAAPIPTLGLLLLAAACGGDDSPTGPGESNLTAEEAAEVLAVLSLVYVPSPSVGLAGAGTPVRSGAAGEGGAEAPLLTSGPPPAAPASEPVWDVASSRWTLTCPSGGELVAEQRDSLGISSDFRLDAGGDTTVVAESTVQGFSEIEMRYRGCTVSSPLTGRTWRFSSETTPMVYLLETTATARSVSLADGAFDYRGTATSDGTYAGTLSWEEGGRSGACAFDLATTFGYDYDASTSTWWSVTRGTSCGIPVADTLRGTVSLGS